MGASSWRLPGVNATPLISDSFLTFRYKMFPGYLHVSCHRPEISYLFKERWSFLWQMVFRNQSLVPGTLIVAGTSVFSSRPSPQKQMVSLQWHFQLRLNITVISWNFFLLLLLYIRNLACEQHQQNYLCFIVPESYKKAMPF